MDVWAVINSKGGSAKSTTAINLAVASASAGHQTVIFDADEQGTATAWWKRREEPPETPYLSPTSPEAVAEDLEKARGFGFSRVVIDTPGFAGMRATAAARCAQFVIVPCQPTMADLQSTMDTARMLLKEGVSFGFVIVRAPHSGAEVAETKYALQGVGPVCPVVNHERKAFQRAYVAAQGLLEYAQVDSSAAKAATESAAVYDWVERKARRLTGGTALSGAASSLTIATSGPPAGAEEVGSESPAPLTMAVGGAR